MAFRNLGLNPQSWPYLVLKAQHPITLEWFYFTDKCLPFGVSISCKLFQDFLDAIAHIMKHKTQKRTVNYLDDFLFAAILKAWCDWQINVFLDICKDINFPVSFEKTEWGNTLMVFLGLLLDTTRQLVCIPKEIVERAIHLIEYCLSKKKVTVL